MTKRPSRDLLAAMNSVKSEPPPDKLEALTGMASEVRDLEVRISDAEQLLSELNARRDELLRVEMANLMDELKVPSITVAASDNLPPITISMKTHISASISSKWDDKRRKLAFSWLDAHGAGDLIKTTVEVKFRREDRVKALEFFKKLKNLDASIDEKVHAATLTSWLRETVNGGTVPPLDVIGGVMVRTAKVESKS